LPNALFSLENPDLKDVLGRFVNENWVNLEGKFLISSKIPKTAIVFINKIKNEIVLYPTQAAAANACNNASSLQETLKTVDFSKEIIWFKHNDEWNNYLLCIKKEEI
jgi:hypothetical protein